MRDVLKKFGWLLRYLIVWTPAAVFIVHAALITRVLSVFGHWPAQDVDREIYELGDAALTFHRMVADLGVWFLMFAIPAQLFIVIVSAFGYFRLLSRKETAVFWVPILVWIGCNLVWDGFARYYGWYFD